MKQIKILNRYDNNSDGYDGYIRVWLSDGRVIGEHRFIMEQKIGRKLQPNEIVHHKDGNKKNNHIDNLSIETRSFHSASHQEPGEMISLLCDYCNKPFTREMYRIRTKRKHGQKFFYCSRSCGTKHQFKIRNDSLKGKVLD